MSVALEVLQVLANTSNLSGVSLKDALSPMTRRRAERDREFGETLTKRSGLSLEVVVERLQSDEQFEELVERAIVAARLTSYVAKRRALAAVAAEALLDDSKVGLALLVERAVEQLDPIHVRVLRLISEGPPGLRDIDESADQAPSVGGTSIREIRRCLPGEEGSIEAVIGTLTSLGLVYDTRIQAFLSAPDATPAVTDFGIALLLHLYDDDEASSNDS